MSLSIAKSLSSLNIATATKTRLHIAGTLTYTITIGILYTRDIILFECATVIKTEKPTRTQLREQRVTASGNTHGDCHGSMH